MSKTITLQCLKTNNPEFLKGHKYAATLVDGKTWAVKGEFQDYKFPLEHIPCGNLGFVSDCRSVKFVFEVVMK